jgi:hypothetical protein
MTLSPCRGRQAIPDLQFALCGNENSVPSAPKVRIVAPLQLPNVLNKIDLPTIFARPVLRM